MNTAKPLYDIPETGQTMMADQAAADYLNHIGKLHDGRIERYYRENSNGMYSFTAFIEAVYRQAGHDI